MPRARPSTATECTSTDLQPSPRDSDYGVDDTPRLLPSLQAATALTAPGSEPLAAASTDSSDGQEMRPAGPCMPSPKPAPEEGEFQGGAAASLTLALAFQPSADAQAYCMEGLWQEQAIGGGSLEPGSRC